jgi:N-formylglutamate amidohydrolase
VLLASLVMLIAPLPPADVARLVTVRPGTLPIILSAPHGGRGRIPGVPDRKGVAVKQFVVVNDTNTDDLADRLTAAIEKRMGAKPHVVIARFERKQCDANRPAADAYEHPRAKAVYDAYHAALAAARRTVQADWGRGLLLDLHGQAADAGTIFRGTNDGKTVTHLIDRFGKDALTGPKSVLGVLAAKGHKPFPALDSDEKENPRFGGGYISQTYGSRYGGSVDAIQLELGGKQRSRAALDTFAADVAEAVAVFAKEYLPEKGRATGLTLAGYRRLPLWLPPLVVYTADIGLTLAGQPADYWIGDRTALKEANPLAAALLAVHPAAFVSTAILWGVTFVLLIRSRRPWAVVLAFILTCGHAVGAAIWLVRLGPAGWVGGIGVLVVAERLWRRSRLTGQAVLPNSTT